MSTPRCGAMVAPKELKAKIPPLDRGGGKPAGKAGINNGGQPKKKRMMEGRRRYKARKGRRHTAKRRVSKRCLTKQRRVAKQRRVTNQHKTWKAGQWYEPRAKEAGQERWWKMTTPTALLQ